MKNNNTIIIYYFIILFYYYYVVIVVVYCYLRSMLSQHISRTQKSTRCVIQELKKWPTMCSRRNSSIESHPEYYRTKNEAYRGERKRGRGGRGTRAGKRGHIYRRERVPYPVLPSPGPCSVPLEKPKQKKQVHATKVLQYRDPCTPLSTLCISTAACLPPSPRWTENE